MNPFLIRIIIESVLALIVILIFLAIYISRLTLTRWEPRIPEAPPCTVHYPKDLNKNDFSKSIKKAEEAQGTKEAEADTYPVLLIHGFASSPSTFHPTYCIAPLLLENRPVALVSYRPRTDGPDVNITRVFTHSLFGCLPRTALPVSIETMAADLVVLINERGWEKVHVVGHSMGGMVAQALSIEIPERIVSLTTIGSCVGPGLGPCVPRLGRLLWDAIRVVLPRLREQMIGEDSLADDSTTKPEDSNCNKFIDLNDISVCRDELSLTREAAWEAKAAERRRFRQQQARSEWGHRQLTAIITSKGRARKLDSLVRRGRLRASIVAVSGALDERIAPRSSTVAGQRITGCRSYVVGGMSHTPRGAEWSEILRIAGLVRSNNKQANI